MKKTRILLFLCAIVASFVMLSSCRVTGNSPDEGNNGDTGNLNSSGNIIFSPEVDVNVIVSMNQGYDQDTMDMMYEVWRSVANVSATHPSYKNDEQEQIDHEIVLGNTSRDISGKATKKLKQYHDRIINGYSTDITDPTFVEGFCIYAFRGSVAIVWTNDFVVPYAIDFFIKNYLVADTLRLEDEYCLFRAVDCLEVSKAEEKSQREKELAEIESLYGNDTVVALENFISLYNEQFYLWLADLYEPGEYDENGNPVGGGFYYSNSARNTSGFAPDLESTFQVLDFVQNSGMASSREEMLSVLPKSMAEEIVAFVLSCQSPVNGYFYHPQWGTSIVSARRDRDLNWATNLLSMFDKQPYWNTPNGKKGTQGNPPGATGVSALTSRLEESKTFAVSKVIPVAWSGDANLASLSNWETYVKSYQDKISTGSYGIGNTFSAMATQIANRDKMAIKDGELKDSNGDGIADGGYIEIWQKYFDDWQKDHNGLWSDGSVDNGTITYTAVNGLMKISGVYNTLGIKIKNATRAFESALFMAMHIGIGNSGDDWGDSSGKKPNEIVDVYNPLEAMSLLLSNIKKFGSTQEYNELRDMIKVNSAEFIQTTARKTALFKRHDGSFGYGWTSSPHLSNGVPVSVKNTVEGDVNGSVIAVRIYNIAMNLLGIKGLDLYGYSDLLVFSNRIKELGPVIKDEDEFFSETPGKNVRDFEDEEPHEELPNYVTEACLNGSVELIEDSDGNRCIELIAVPGKSGNQVSFKTETTRNPQSLVLEWDMKFGNINNTTATSFQIFMSSYVLTIGVNTDGTFTLGDTSSEGVGIKNSFGSSFDAKEWNKIRVEFYQLDYDSNTTVAYIYVNGYLRFISDNYYGKEKDADPNMSYSTARFYALSGTDLTVYIDNVNAYQSKTAYEKKNVQDPDRIKHFDNVLAGGTELPSGVTTVGGEVSCVPNNESKNNNAIVLNGLDESVTVDTIIANNVVNCYVAIMKTKIDSSFVGEVIEIYLASSTKDKSLAAYKVEVYEDGDKRYARVVEFKKDGSLGNVYDEIETDTWVELAFEFYPHFYETNECSIVYLNGKEIGRSNCYFDPYMLSKDYTNLIVVAKSDMTLAIDDIISEAIDKDFISSSGQKVETPNVLFPKPGIWGGGKYYGDDTCSEETKYDYDGLTQITKSDLLASDSGFPTITVEDDALRVKNRKFALKNSGAKTGATYIFETDLYFENVVATKTSDTIGWIGMSASGAEKTYQFASFAIKYTTDTDGKITRLYICQTNPADVIAELELDVWQNIRIEYTPNLDNTGTVKFYLDGELATEYVTKGYANNAANSNRGFECFGIEVRDGASSGYSGVIWFDNTFMSAFGEAPEFPDNPEPENPEPDQPQPSVPQAPATDNYGKGVYYNDSAYPSEHKYNYNGLSQITKSDLLASDSGFPTIIVENDALRVKNRKFALKNSGVKTGATYIFETDVCFESAVTMRESDIIGWIGMSASGAEKTYQFASFVIKYTADAYGKITRLYICQTTPTNEIAEFELDAWQNIRIEYAPNSDNTGTVKFYLNGELKAEYVTKGYANNAANSNASFECFGIEVRDSASSGYSGVVRVDNTFMSAIGEVSENPTPDVPNQNDPVTNNYGKGKFYIDSSFSNDYKYSYDGLTQIGKTDLLASDSGFPTITVENDALRVKNRKFALKNSGVKTGDTYVFETDMYFENVVATKTSDNIGWIGMSASGAEKTYQFASFVIKYTADADGKITKLYICQTTPTNEIAELELDVWQNIRIEYAPNSDNTGTVKFYLNGELKAEYVTQGYANNAANSNASFECFGIEVRDGASSGYSGVVRVDNTFMSAIAEE